jgi:hypothetical protein
MAEAGGHLLLTTSGHFVMDKVTLTGFSQCTVKICSFGMHGTEQVPDYRIFYIIS